MSDSTPDAVRDAADAADVAGAAGAPGAPGAPGGDGDARARMRADVMEGLARPQKQISPKYFYDHRGSELFEAITRLDEYYPTRTERRLLAESAPALIRSLDPGTLVELGAGAADKTRTILDAMVNGNGVAYVPIDISGEFLEQVSAGLREDYPDVDVRPLVADMTRGFRLPDDLPTPILFALLGGTIGNFPPERAARLLGRVRSAMGSGDRLLLGMDLVKDVDVLERAYNDAAGVTAAFNGNVLRVLNRELGADFDTDAFRHRAFYDREAARIEMHLVAERAMDVTIPDGGTIHFEAGETVRTELSCKYTRETARALFEEAGLRMTDWLEAPPGFALAVAEAG